MRRRLCCGTLLTLRLRFSRLLAFSSQPKQHPKMKAALKPTSASTTSTAHGDQMIGEDGWPVHLEALVGPGLSSPSGDVEGIRMENFPDEGWTCYIIKKKTRGKDVVKYQHPTCEKALGKAAFKTYSNKGGVMTVDLEKFPFLLELIQ